MVVPCAFSDLVLNFRGRREGILVFWCLKSTFRGACKICKRLELHADFVQARRFGLGGRLWPALNLWQVQCVVNFGHAARFQPELGSSIARHLRIDLLNLSLEVLCCETQGQGCAV